MTWSTRNPEPGPWVVCPDCGGHYRENAQNEHSCLARRRTAGLVGGGLGVGIGIVDRHPVFFGVTGVAAASRTLRRYLLLGSLLLIFVGSIALTIVRRNGGPEVILPALMLVIGCLGLLSWIASCFFAWIGFDQRC
jgi:hypothetical protein